MLQYLLGELEIPDYAVPIVIDDVNNGNITTLDGVKRRRTETRDALIEAATVVLEVSSLKRIKFVTHDGLRSVYANITSLKNLELGVCKANFVDINATLSMLPNTHTQAYCQSDFHDDISKILHYLSDKKVILVSHFNATIAASGQPIAERITLGNWLRDEAAHAGCDFIDQSDLVKRLGRSVALKDTSHYTDAGERAMASVLSAQIDGTRE